MAVAQNLGRVCSQQAGEQNQSAAIGVPLPLFPQSFICSALQKMPLERPTVLEMLQHPFIESFRNRR